MSYIPKPVLYAVIVIVVLVVVYWITHYNTTEYEDYLYGFWVAEADAFCEDAEIDSLLMFIGEKENGIRNCYLVIMPEIANQSFTLSHGTSMAGPGISNYEVKAAVSFDEEPLWPDEVNINVDMRDGTIKISSGDTIYVRAQKQHDTTNISKFLDEDE